MLIYLKIWYHSSRKIAAILYVFGCRVAPTITYICLREGYSIENLKILYLQYEVSGDKFCGHEVTVIKPIDYDLYVSCYYL